MSDTELPVQSVLADIRDGLRRHDQLVLQAPPGAGKTTLVPLALLDEAWLGGERIVMLEPRRIATRAAAARMAELLGETVGQRVGYRMRLESKVSRQTRIEIMTEGVLTRMLSDDPGLEGIGLVIFDEFHERSLDADLALALLRKMRGEGRGPRLLVMSATAGRRGGPSASPTRCVTPCSPRSTSIPRAASWPSCPGRATSASSKRRSPAAAAASR